MTPGVSMELWLVTVGATSSIGESEPVLQERVSTGIALGGSIASPTLGQTKSDRFESESIGSESEKCCGYKGRQ